MDRVRQVAGVLAACAVAATGCTTTQQQSFKRSVTEAFVPPPPAVASHFECMWNNRLMSLPDPSRNGASVPGLAGQGLLYGADLKTVDVTGDLTVTVHDATARPPGMPAMRSEVWHFTKDTVKNMVSMDERYGRSLVLFVPWPETWRDVNAVHIQARYDQPGGTVLYCKAATVTLDMNAPGGLAATAATNMLPAVPDPAKLLQQARAASATPPQLHPQYPAAMAGAMPAQQQQYAPPGYGMPPAGTVQPAGYAPYPQATPTGYHAQPPVGYAPPPAPGYQPPASATVLPVLPPTPPQGYVPPPMMPVPPGGVPIFQPPVLNVPPQPAAPTPPLPPDRIVIPRG